MRLKQVDEMPSGVRDSGWTRKLIDEFLASDYKLVTIEDLDRDPKTAVMSLASAIKRLELQDKVRVRKVNEQVFLELQEEEEGE